MLLMAFVMGIAGLLGFSLAIYFFFYRVRLTTPWRWLGGMVGGLILAVLLAMTAYMVLWPPVNAVITFAGALIAVLVTGAALFGGENIQKGVKSNEDMDDYQLDINSGTGS